MQFVVWNVLCKGLQHMFSVEDIHFHSALMYAGFKWTYPVGITAVFSPTVTRSLRNSLLNNCLFAINFQNSMGHFSNCWLAGDYLVESGNCHDVIGF